MSDELSKALNTIAEDKTGAFSGRAMVGMTRTQEIKMAWANLDEGTARKLDEALASDFSRWVGKFVDGEIAAYEFFDLLNDINNRRSV